MTVGAVKHRWSLITRLVFMVVIAVGLSLGLFALLTVARLEQGARIQERAVSQLARERIGEQMRLQTRLIAGELSQFLVQVDTASRALANHENTHKVLARGNIVAIDRMLKNVVDSSSLDGLLAFDIQLNALGSHKPGLLLSNVNKMFSGSENSALSRGLIFGNDRRRPIAHTAFQAGDFNSLLAMGMDVKSDSLVVVSIHPVFDDFGDVAALLVAHRLVGSDNTALTRYGNHNAFGVRIINGVRVLFDTGNGLEKAALHSQAKLLKMGTTKQGTFLFQCESFNLTWRLCVYEPLAKLTKLTKSLVDFIHEEKRALIIWLLLLAFGSIAVAALVSTAVIRQVMAPLQQITQAVRSVAKGNWLAHVAGQRRRDEVGDIARAVVVLQRSMKERERLKADVADIVQLKARQSEVYEATQTGRSNLRRHMFGLLELTENIELNAQKLSGLAGLAEGEADEARLVIGRSLKHFGQGQDNLQAPVCLVNESIDRLGETVEELSSGALNLSHAVGFMNEEVRGVERVVKEMMGAVSDQYVDDETNAEVENV